MKKHLLKKWVVSLMVLVQLSLGFAVQAVDQIEWVHGFYAISSSAQMEVIPKLDAISFGWAQVQYDEVTKTIGLHTSQTMGNNFYVPIGFEKPMDLAKDNQVETYLMIYLEDRVIEVTEQGQKIMLSDKAFKDSAQRQKLIQDIVKLCNTLTKDGVTRSFDGVTIDFENLVSSQIQKPFNIFLQDLNKALDQTGKKLNVAVQPNAYFKGYDYRGIGEVADKVILMAHDYAPKVMTQSDLERGKVVTPLTPIQQVKQDLQAMMHPETGVKDVSKVALQVSFASTQWQVKDGKVLNAKPYTPSYDKIYQRLLMPGTEKFYHEIYQNPYAAYTQDGVRNVIWYENETSVNAKIQLAQMLGIKNLSFWRLGTLPDFKATNGQVTRLDILGNTSIFGSEK